MIKIFIIIFLAYLPEVQIAPSLVDSEIDSTRESQYEIMLENAVEHLYQTRWDKAGEAINELKRHSPEDPRPYFFESLMPFWEYFFVHQQSDLADLFLKRSEIAVKLGDQKLNEHPNDTTLVLLLSGLHGYRSLVAAGEKKYRIALQSGINGFNYTRQLLSIDSDRPDAQIGRGMYYYMAGSVPREVRWLTNAAGIRGDIEMGFHELEKAAGSNNPIKYDAQMMLMYLYEKEKNYGEALMYAQKLSERFPKNVIFHFKCGELNQIMGNNDHAIEKYKQVIDEDNSYLKQITEISKERVNELYAIGLKRN